MCVDWDVAFESREMLAQCTGMEVGGGPSAAVGYLHAFQWVCRCSTRWHAHSCGHQQRGSSCTCRSVHQPSSPALQQMLTLARPHRTEQPDGQTEEGADELSRVLLQHPTLRVRVDCYCLQHWLITRDT